MEVSLKQRLILCLVFLRMTLTTSLVIALPSDFDQSNKDIKVANKGNDDKWSLYLSPIQSSAESRYAASEFLRMALALQKNKAVQQQLDQSENSFHYGDSHSKVRDKFGSGVRSLNLPISLVFQNQGKRNDHASALQSPYMKYVRPKDSKEDFRGDTKNIEGFQLAPETLGSLEKLTRYVKDQLWMNPEGSYGNEMETKGWDSSNENPDQDAQDSVMPSETKWANGGTDLSSHHGRRPGDERRPSWAKDERNEVRKRSKDWRGTYVLGAAMGRRRK